jgi:hypothetical protein
MHYIHLPILHEQFRKEKKILSLQTLPAKSKWISMVDFEKAKGRKSFLCVMGLNVSTFEFVLKTFDRVWPFKNRKRIFTSEHALGLIETLDVSSFSQ